MADFNDIEKLIRDEIVTNGQGNIDAVLLRGVLIGMLDAVGDALDGKVNTVSGKGLSTNDFTDALKMKLENMPEIKDYDSVNHRVTIGSEVYQLTPYKAVPDYYIGWTSGTSEEFAAKSEQQLVDSATPYMVSSHPTYTHSCTNIIFYVMFTADHAPESGSLSSGGLISQITAQEFLEGGSCPHDDVTIDGTVYKIYGMRNRDLIGDTNIISKCSKLVFY